MALSPFPMVYCTMENFWNKVDKTSSCWIWTAFKDRDGYGKLRNEYAHRVSYILHVGEIPKGYVIDHLCRVPSCVNPDHLDLVTPRENTLRGVGPSAINAKKTHCKRGHEFTPENTYLKSGNRRVCKTCRREGMRELRAERSRP